MFFPKRISTNVRINISLYLDPITFSIYLLLGLIYFIFINFYLFLAVLGCHFCEGFSVVAANGGYALVTVHGLLIAVAFLVVSTGFRARRLWTQDSLNYSMASGSFPDQGLNSYFLHWQVDLNH